MPKPKIEDIIIKKGKKKRDFFDEPIKRVRKNRDNDLFKKMKKGKIIFGLVVLFLVVVLSAKTVGFFAKAIIQITLHQEVVSIDTLVKSGKTAFFDVPFETMEIKVTKENSTQATGVKNIATKASGTIVVYNSFSSKSQKLIATTRFEAPDGKIYRIKKSIIVPGAKIIDGEVQPSSIEAVVYADKPGEEYNKELTDFTIPGFKGGPRYEKFYARSKTTMAGGFSGEVPVVSDSDFNNLKNSLEASIRTALLEKAVEKKPEGFLLYSGAIQITFSENEAQNSTDLISTNPEFKIKETGTLYAVLIPENILSKILVGKYLGEDMLGKVKINNLEKLDFDLISLDKEKQSMVFKLSGNANFVWILDEAKLKEALIASPERLEEVFKNYPAIDHASIVFSPSWWRFFPEKESKIRIEEIVN